jgi:hypothetical protein
MALKSKNMIFFNVKNFKVLFSLKNKICFGLRFQQPGNMVTFGYFCVPVPNDSSPL